MTRFDSTQQPKRYADRRPEGPRRVKHGLKLQGVFDFGLQTPLADPSAATVDPQAVATPEVSSSLAQRWYALASSRFDQSALIEGSEYGKSGQAVNLELQAGTIRAAVQGTAARPYQVQIAVPSFDQEQWRTVIESMSEEAVYSAKMLSGELPAGTDELLAVFGLRLLPEQPEGLRMSCSCAQAQPCKHQATVVMLVAERLQQTPLVLLTLLGMPAEQLIERLQRARTIQAKGSASAHGDALIPESLIEPPPLEACIDAFWHSSHDFKELAGQSASVHAPHALLRRLGPSPLSGKFPMVGLLASVYDTVAQAARRVADQTPGEEQSIAADEDLT